MPWCNALDKGFLRHKTKLADIGFFRDFVDSHSHILPGVDDGIRTIEESLAVLAYFDSLGVKKVRLTPHVMNGVEHWEDVLQAFDTLRKRYTGETVLELGAEYMLDSGFRERLGKGLQPLCGDCVLVETSYFSPPNNLDELLYDVSLAGYTPVIAHPERYLYMRYGDYCELKDKGYLLQLNLLSLSGYYGKQVMKNAETLLEKGMYDMVGTDLHNLETFGKWIGNVRLTDKLAREIMSLR